MHKIENEGEAPGTTVISVPTPTPLLVALIVTLSLLLTARAVTVNVPDSAAVGMAKLEGRGNRVSGGGLGGERDG